MNNDELTQRIQRVHPEFFGRNENYWEPGGLQRRIIDTWPLPRWRVLFACRTREYKPVGGARYTIDVNLYVYNLRAENKPKQLREQGANGEKARGAAIAWVQGLRDEDLSAYDADMLDWLGEIAYRMSPDQLTRFTEQYFAIAPDAWGTPDNPGPGPGEHLGEVLSSMGFTDDYLDMHWQS